ncbi:MAG: hypothetical protein KGL39_59585 [Patescibacteria group bacterium]|nr:hypothetical protein [Patescibacteria group bacterium]
MGDILPKPPRRHNMTLPAVAIPYQFKPGQSGNPSGKPKTKPLEAEIRRMAQRMTPEIMHKLGEIALDEALDYHGNRLKRAKPGRPRLEEMYQPHHDVRAQIAAASIVLDRAWGKPKEEEVEELQVPKPNVRALNDKQREQLRKLVRYMLNRSEPEDDGED